MRLRTSTESENPMTDQNWFPEAWRPEPGDTVHGFVVKVAAADGDYGPYPVVTIRTTQLPQGEVDVAVHAFHDMLRSELADRQVQAGDQLTITYLGKHPEKGYYGYRVSGTDKPFDWTQFGGRPTPGPPPNTPAATPRTQASSPAPDVPVDQSDFTPRTPQPPPEQYPEDDDIPF
jgi:hypothetical protein